MLRGVRCRRHRRAEAVLKYSRRQPEPQCVGERVREAEGRGDGVGAEEALLWDVPQRFRGNGVLENAEAYGDLCTQELAPRRTL